MKEKKGFYNLKPYIRPYPITVKWMTTIEITWGQIRDERWYGEGWFPMYVNLYQRAKKQIHNYIFKKHRVGIWHSH